MTEAVTELVVRGDGALAVLDRYEDKMTDAGQATERSTGAIDRYNAAMAKFAAAQQQGLAITTQSVARRTAEERAMDRWQATLSKTAKLEVQFRREAERAAVDMANAVALGYTTPQRAVAVLTALEQKHAAQLRDSATAARQLDAALEGANDNRRILPRGAGSFNTANIAAQFQDIGVTAAMGMNPLQIALQQGTQLSAVFEQMKASGQSAASGLATAFASIVSPISLVTIGVIALVAAGLQMVDWSKSAAWAIDLLADNLEMIAPYAVAAAGAITLMYAPSIVTGLVHLIALIARVGTAALAAAGSFTAAWLAAMGPVGCIIAGLGAVAAAAFLLRDQIKSAIGVDVVAVFTAAGNFIINSFEAAYSDVKFIWSNFGDMMGAVVVGGVNIAIRAINDLIDKAREGIDKLIDYANQLPGVNISPLGPGGAGIKELDNPYADRLSRANAGHATEIERIMGQDRLGQFGAAIGEGASFASDKFRELSDWMTKVDEKDKKSRRGKTNEEKAARRYDRLVRGAEQFIAAQELERQAMFMTEEAAAALRYEQDLLNQAANANIKLTPEQTAQLRSLAQEMAGAEAQTYRLREALDFAKDLAKGFASDFRSAFAEARSEGLSTWDSFWRGMADAAVNALDKIVDKLMNDVMDAIFQVNSAGSSRGGGGILGFLGGLFGGGSGGFSAFEHAWTAAVPGLWARGGAFDGSGVVPFAKGAAFTNSIVSRPTLFPFAKGIGLMGEAGPEAIMPLRRGADGRLGVSATNSNQGSQPVYAPVYQIDAREASDGVEDKIKRVLRDHDRQSYQRFLRDYSEAQKRGTVA